MFVTKGTSFGGEITASPSKSHEQRLICGAILAKGKSKIYNYGNSDDVKIARKIAESFGADVSVKSDYVEISGNHTANEVLFCGESGLCARMFTPIACLFNDSFVISGEKTLLKRPITAGFDIFKQMNCVYSSDNGKLPIKFSKAQLIPGIYELKDSVTSQLISGLIIAMPLLGASSKLIINNPVSLPYILLTIETLKGFGIHVNYKVSEQNLIVDIIGNQNYSPVETNVEGDWSSATFPLVGAAINGKIDISGLKIDSVQADRAILQVFDLAGVGYSIDNHRVSVEKSYIKSFNFDANDCPDLIPALIVLALEADGISTISGTERLKYKESSRAEVMKKELNKSGVDIIIDNNKIIIHGKQKPKGGVVCSNGDHRIAMALTVMGLSSEKPIKIMNHECISKSYLYFYEDMLKLGANIYE